MSLIGGVILWPSCRRSGVSLEYGVLGLVV